MRLVTARRVRMLLGIAVLLAVLLTGGELAGAPVARAVTDGVAHRGEPVGAPSGLPPIHHVVIVYQENHSFDNVLGALCVEDARCDGATTGQLATGATIPLSQATDLVPSAAHYGHDQITAMDGGKMDGFSKLSTCNQTTGYRCYSQFQPSQIPNLAALARAYAISDRTFQMDTIPSWGAHMELASGTLDGFTVSPGPNPFPSKTGAPPLSGWGCESHLDAWWGSPNQAVPSCVPDPALNPTLYPFGGAYRATPVPYVPTIMDRLDQAGLSWGIYAGAGSWAVCPTFAECQYTAQKAHQHSATQFLTDAAAGKLPNLTIVTPSAKNSQHNNYSMLQGDNWIGQVVQAVMKSSDWASTAIFITYDDCGCFYDHVRPPSGMGIRMPMVIVSPYARPGYTDSTIASFASMLAFTEHVFGLQPLTSADANAYDYANAFDATRKAAPAVPHLATRPIPRRERRYIAHHPADLARDPT